MSVGQARAADAPPLVETGPADYFPEDEDLVEVTGKVNTLGTQLTECYFEYGATVAYGMRAEAWGESCNSEFAPGSNEPKEVKGKLLNFFPGVVYHYRLVARNDFGVATGADRTVGTTGDDTLPKDKPGGDDPAPPGSPPPAGPTSPPPSEESGCPAVKLIGARGSGEPQGLGRPVGAFARALADRLDMRLNGDDYRATWVSYPAFLPKFKPKHWYSGLFEDASEVKEYQRSVQAGADALRTMLHGDPCRSRSRYVLAGYSQGAQVIGDAIAGDDLKRVRNRLVATIFFGDPTFDATMRGVEFSGSFSPRKKGLLRRLGTRDRDSFRGYGVVSFCRRSDPFCQSDIDAASHGRLAGHEHYQDQEADQAAKWVTARLR